MEIKTKKESFKRKIHESLNMEKRRNLHLAKVISLAIAILGLAIMTPLSYSQNNMTMVVCSVTYGIMAVLAFIYTLIRKDLMGFNIITIVMTYFLIIQYLLNGGNEGFGLTWVLIFPLLYLYMLDIGFFMGLAFANVLIIGIAFFTPLNQFIYQGWNGAYKTRFFLVLTIETIFATAFKFASSNTDKSRNDIMGELLDLQQTLQDKVRSRTAELLKAKKASDKFMIELSMSLAATIDAKDKYTSGHSKRVADYSKEIAKRLGKSDEELERIYLISLLHDIGKIGIPDEIINKQTKLTDEEFEVIKTHPEIGSDILKNIETIPEIRTGVRWHHERFDGNGYPDGLKASEIPEYAQIIAVADSYDAMTSNRSYRNLMSQATVRKEIEKGSGSQFSPAIASIMLTIIDEDVNYTLHE